MIHRRALIAVLATVPLLIAGCATPPPERPRLDLRFTQAPPMVLSVDGVRVESAYVPPMAPPNVDHEFPVPPLKAVETWTEDRLRGVGGVVGAVMVVEDASAWRESLPTDRGFTGLFKQEQSDRWHVRIAARLEIRDARGRVLAQTHAVVGRSVSTPENITLNDRDLVWYRLTSDAMGDFDDLMDRDIRRHMAAWLR